jgi:hypothetical protein
MLRHPKGTKRVSQSSLVDMFAEELDMGSEIKLEAEEILVWEKLCAAVLQPNLMPRILQPRQIRRIRWNISNRPQVRSDAIPVYTGKYLLHRSKIELAPGSATRIDDNECIFREFLVIPRPEESAARRAFFDWRS